MAIKLAWHNLLHNKVKTGVAIAGVVFAIVLMFMQLGFLEAVKASATLVYDQLAFDICIRSKDYLNLADARTFPRQRLQQAAAISGVERAVPLSVAVGAWRNPQVGYRLAALCLGVPHASKVFRSAAIQGPVEKQLRQPDAMLVDTKTRWEFGPRDGKRFGKQDVGTRVEINNVAFQIVGEYACGTGLANGGAVIMEESALQQISPTLGPNAASLGLIRVAGGDDIQTVAAALRSALPDDVDVLTRPEVLRGEVAYWVYDTNYGLIFQMGVAISLVVGIAIVYQVLVSDVASLLPEYATLKAIGYGNRYLARVILEQSLAMAVLGFLCGCVLSLGLYALTAAGAQIPVRMTWTNFAVVLLLSVLMCAGSGLGAVRKAFQAEPADLF
jgi:putative ABC transport system permease protein